MGRDGKKAGKYGMNWEDEKVEEVLDSLALTGNYCMTARETGVPKSTVARWANHFGGEITRRREKMLGSQHEARVEKAIEWNEKIGEEMQEALEGLLAEIQAKMGGRKVSLRDLAYAFDRVYDKHQLHGGGATQRNEMLVKFLEAYREGEE